jgi:hypothetical protein
LEVFWRKTGDNLDGNLNSTLIYFYHSKELPMSTQSIIQQVRWQDLKVRSDLEVVLELAKKEGWEDCEVFGSGDMITEPQESRGWKLIPADVYEGKIPAEAANRLYQVIVAGIRVRGVIIADDERGTPPPPAPAPAPIPAQPEVSLPSIEPILSFLGKALFTLICAAGIIAVLAALAASLLYAAPILILFGLFSGTGSAPGTEYDPKLVILVDDGAGGTAWVSLFTWYD